MRWVWVLSTLRRLQLSDSPGVPAGNDTLAEPLLCANSEVGRKALLSSIRARLVFEHGWAFCFDFLFPGTIGKKRFADNMGDMTLATPRLCPGDHFQRPLSSGRRGV